MKTVEKGTTFLGNVRCNVCQSMEDVVAIVL